MRKIGYIALLLILLMQIGGPVLIFKMQQYNVQLEMNQALNNRETRFQKLILSLNDFQKSRINAHEMYFNGKMYDVKSFKITSDKVELLVINDTKEENILANIKKSADTGTEQNKKLSFRQVNLLNWFYIYPDSGNKFILQKQKINYPSFAENALSVINEISTPPPESV